MIAVLMVFDAFTTQAWFDMIGRALSPRVRARVITINSLLGSAGGIGAGLVVAQVLASPQLPFPTNYAVLFFLAWLFITFSLVSMLLIRERVSDSTQTMQAHPSNFNATLRAAWQNDPAFRRLLLSRLLTGWRTWPPRSTSCLRASALASRERHWRVYDSVCGRRVWRHRPVRPLSERFGPRRTINPAAALQFLAPLIAFVIASLQPSNLTTFQPANLSTFSYLALILVMAINGAVNRSTQLGYFSYAQDHAPEIDRPIYVGAVSTIGGTASLLPVLGGVLIDAMLRSSLSAAAYPVLFGIVMVTVGMGAWMSLGLPKPGRV